MNRRNTVLALLAFGVTPLISVAQQQGKVWRVGFLATYPRSEYMGYSDAFKAGMRALGHAEGRDYAIEYRFADGDLKRLPALAAELVALKVDVILAAATVSAVATRKVTREIPIIIATAADPVEAGLATSLSQPGGNVTGLTGLGLELLPKRLELMREILPAIQRAGFVFNPDSPFDLLLLNEFQSGAKKLGIQSISVVVRNSEGVKDAFQKLVVEKANAVFVSPTLVNITLRASLVEHARKHRLPGMYGSGEFVRSGGLISYSPNYADQYRRAAEYVDSIMKGKKPGDMPIAQPTKFELVINLQTAKALGLKFSNSLLVRADRVIE